MRRLLVAGALAVLALLVVLLREVGSGADAAPSIAAAATVPAAPRANAVNATTTTPPVVAQAQAASQDGKVNPNSDDFFDHFVERQPKAVSKAAMSCYRGGLHRRTMDQWIKISFVGHIKDGEVTFSDVKAKESRLDDPELEHCMLAAAAAVHWHDDTLPDVERYEDETVLNPERGGKKYMNQDL